jgi:hypothetical protein
VGVFRRRGRTRGWFGRMVLVRRRLFTFFTALSLLMCVIVCVLWVRSYFVADGFDWSSQERTVAALSDSGWTYVAVVNGAARAAPARFSERPSWSRKESLTIALPYGPTVMVPARSAAGETRLPGIFAHAVHSFPDSVRPAVLYPVRVVGIGYALITTTFALAPAIMWGSPIVRALRRGGATASLCPTCGYDLRATPGRCPECGAVKVTARSGSASPSSLLCRCCCAWRCACCGCEVGRHSMGSSGAAPSVCIGCTLRGGVWAWNGTTRISIATPTWRRWTSGR